MSTGPTQDEPGLETGADPGPSVPSQEPSVTGAGEVTGPGPSSRRPSRLRQVPRVVWALVGLQFLLGLLCTIIYPPFTGYDESWHTDMVWSYYHFNGVDGPGERLRDRGVEVATEMIPVPNPVPKTPYAQTPLPARGDRPSLDALDDGRQVDYPQPNQMTQHPPLYYATEAGLLHLVPYGASLPYDRQVWLMRLFTLVMVLPVPLFCWAAARRLTGSATIAVLAAAVPVTLPGLARLAGSVNNDNLLIALASALVYLLARVVTSDLSVRTGAWVGVVGGLALLTKGFALAFPVVVVAAYVVGWLRERTFAFRPLLVAGVLTSVVGGWWWVRNLVEYGALQPSGLGKEWTDLVVGPARPGGQLSDFVPGFFERMGNRLYSGIGLLDNPRLPGWLNDGWVAALLVGLVAAVVLGLRQRRWSRGGAVVLALPALGALAIVFMGARHAYLHNMRYSGIQGRYVYTGIAGLAVLAAWGWCRLTGRASRYLTPVVLVAGLLTQAYAWLALVRAWWAPRTGSDVDRLEKGLDGVDRWSPWPEGVNIAVVVLIAAVAVAALVLAVRYARAAPEGGEPAEPAPSREPVAVG
jgi:small subunit ribosomal protein S36